MSQAVALAVIVGVVGGLTGAWLVRRDDEHRRHHRKSERPAAASASKLDRRTPAAVSAR